VLLELLAEQALDHGILRFRAETFADNTRMIKVLRHSGRASHLSVDHGYVTVDIELAAEG